MPRYSLKSRLVELKLSFNPKRLLQRYQLNQRSWLIIILTLVSITGLLYLFQINSLATKGYEINDLEEKAAELREHNKKFKLEITELRSTERITQAAQRMDLVKVARVEYLKANGTSVAINR